VLEIADGSAGKQVRSSVARATVDIDNDGPFPGKTFEDASLDRLDDRLYGFGIIVGRHPNEDVHLAHIDKLAKKFVGQKGFFDQINPQSFRRIYFASRPTS
jgi:hypothetical protein